MTEPIFISNLGREYGLDEVGRTRLLGLYSLISLRLDFALMIARRKGWSLCDTIKDGIGGWRFNEDEFVLREYEDFTLNNFEDPVLYEDICARLFDSSSFVFELLTEPQRNSCFSYELENMGEGLPRRVSFHFDNAVVPENPFLGYETGSGEYGMREEEMRRLCQEIKELDEKFEEYTRIGSWLLVSRACSSFFPNYDVSEEIDYSPLRNGMSIWGQFITHKGEFNESRAEEFRRTWSKNIWKFPIPKIRRRFKLQDLFEMYDV